MPLPREERLETFGYADDALELRIEVDPGGMARITRLAAPGDACSADVALPLADVILAGVGRAAVLRIRGRRAAAVYRARAFACRVVAGNAGGSGRSGDRAAGGGALPDPGRAGGAAVLGTAGQRRRRPGDGRVGHVVPLCRVCRVCQLT